MKSLVVTHLKILLLPCFLMLSISMKGQTLFLQENFDLNPGTDLSGQNNWTLGTASTNRVMVTGTGLSYPGYPNATVGNAASFVPTTDRLQKVFEGTLTGTYYYSFLINVTSAGSGDYFIGFFTNSAFRGRTYIKADGAGFQFGLTKTTSGVVGYTSGTPYSFGTTYLVVVKYEFLTGSGTDDKVSLYVNPDLSALTPGTPNIGPLTDTGNDASANVFAIQGRANSGNFTLDGIRVAPNWESIKGETVVNHFLELPKFISSHMVLQRECPLKFRGWGSPGDTIVVEFNRQGQIVSDSALIDPSGHWSLQIPSQPVCSEPCVLKFCILNKPETMQTLDDILVGDVWFAGGQSNMEKKVSHLLEANQFITEADNYPLIRSFRASYFANTKPQERVNGSSLPWFVCNSTEVGDKVSAVAYVYARKLFTELNIPIGIMQSYRGGTELETWMSRSKITGDPELCKVAGRISGMDSTDMAAYPSIHFNGQINPLVGFPIKGFIYYQGESNIKRAPEFRHMMKKLIEDWRSLWGMGNLPFYYIQMPNMGVSVSREYEEGSWQDLREQQQLLLTDDHVQNIDMAVTIDTNEDPNNADDAIRMHPKNKKPVGERLAKVSLMKTYGFNITGESPQLSSYKISRDTIYLIFKNQGEGLRIKTGDSKLYGFVIAGNDKIFKSATAEIVNDSTLTVQSNEVLQPVAVRYGWAKDPLCNLYNSVDLPASPFRTDNWPSGNVYSTFTSTCTPNSDASLLSLKLNGSKLSGFNPEILNYNMNTSEIQQVSAISYSPFSTVTIEQASVGNSAKATVIVTAEDKTVRKYEVAFSNPTSLHQATDNIINVTQQNKTICINIKDNLTAALKIYNSTGQCMCADKLKGNTTNKYIFKQSGIYLVHLSTVNGDYASKYIIN